MKLRSKYFYFFFTLVFLLMGAYTIQAQQILNGDTVQIKVGHSKSPFGNLGIPAELMDINGMQDIAITGFGKLDLYKDYAEDLRKYGLAAPSINLKNPIKRLHPVLYGALVVGAFFNNRGYTNIPEEQQKKVMDNIYDFPTASSRYNYVQYNISRGAFNSKNVVSGYKESLPASVPGNSIGRARQ